MLGFLLVTIFVYNIHCLSDFGDRSSLDQSQTSDGMYGPISPDLEDERDKCRNTGKNCSDLDYVCMNCAYSLDCIYGDEYAINCSVVKDINCVGDREFTKVARCQYCYQTDSSEHTCIQKYNCVSVASPPQYYKTNCTVHGHVICHGNRKFPKKLKCNWTRGHKWSTALILSVTLGGFGADRFYLGHWQEGIGKLFSFGGLGVWTLVDVLLISIRYLGPADGSFYV